MRNIINNFKNDISKIISIKEKINKLKKYTNKFCLGVFSFLSIITAYGLTAILNLEISPPVTEIDLTLLYCFSLFIMTVINAGISYLSLTQLIKFKEKKERDTFNNINNFILDNEELYYKKELNEILNEKELLSEDTKEFEKTYFKKGLKTKEEILYDLILAHLKKDKNKSMYEIDNYKLILKEELNDKYYEKIIKELILSLVINLSRNDFFNYKNKLIDLMSSENIDIDSKKEILNKIKETIDFHKSKEVEEEDFNQQLKEIKSIKDEDSINKINKIKKEANVLIKSI
jgi:hypothetical protein